jgi:hypothetical protein
MDSESANVYEIIEEEEMPDRDRRLEILTKVANNEITIEEAARILALLEINELPVEDTPPVDQKALPEAQDIPAEVLPRTETVVPSAAAKEINKETRGWAEWWIIPFAAGVFFTVMGAVWMYQGYLAGGMRWGFWLAWIPFLLGVAVSAVSWMSRSMLWLHVRVRQRPGEKPGLIAISLPVPMRLVRWGLGFARSRVNDEQQRGYMDMAYEVLEDDDLITDTPLHVKVSEDGEEVEVYLGRGR